LNASVRSLVAAFNTNTAAAFGILGWVLVDMIRYKGKFSAVGACLGAIAGLVGITPAAGYVSFWLAGLIGFLTGAVCSAVQNLNEWIRVDEGMDVFKLHGIGGMVGSFLTGIFAQQWVSALDGATLAPGGLDGVGVQVGRQLADICAVSAYSFTMSAIILVILKYTPGMGLRVSEEAEMIGLDIHQFHDEQIGDWSYFDSIGKPNHTATTIDGKSQPVSSSGSAHDAEGVKTA
jgi:Amt family ammonium transporter